MRVLSDYGAIRSAVKLKMWVKKGVKWHDGKPFSARDVAFTFYSVLDPKVITPHRAYFDMLASFPELTNKDNPKKPEELAVKPIEVLDDHTVRFRLRYPSGAFLAVRSSSRGPQADRKSHHVHARSAGAAARKPVSMARSITASTCRP